jgi:hypothetical protein
MRPSSRRFIIPAFLAGACGGSAGQGGAPAPVPGVPTAGEEQLQPRTEAVLAGPLCQSDSCRCREGDADAGAPAAGLKRFEVRLGPSDDPLWAVVDGMVMFKSDQRQEACFYVDLKSGTHAVRFRDRGKQGLNAAVAIAEQGGAEDATWWYHTFDFQCGAPGACDVETIERWKQQVTALRGKHDPCGSTKVQAIRWETGRMPDRTPDQPDDIDLHFTLDVYKFTPENPPGSDECDKRPASGQEGGAAE